MASINTNQQSGFYSPPIKLKEHFEEKAIKPGELYYNEDDFRFYSSMAAIGTLIDKLNFPNEND